MFFCECMQALSENSPDLIARFNATGQFFYINPVIEDFTGQRPDYYMRKNLNEAGLDESVEARWQHVIEEVVASGEQAEFEMSFPVNGHSRQLRVNAIPEYEGDTAANGMSNTAPDSVLLVSHDITK